MFTALSPESRGCRVLSEGRQSHLFRLLERREAEGPPILPLTPHPALQDVTPSSVRSSAPPSRASTLRFATSSILLRRVASAPTEVARRVCGVRPKKGRSHRKPFCSSFLVCGFARARGCFEHGRSSDAVRLVCMLRCCRARCGRIAGGDVPATTARPLAIAFITRSGGCVCVNE
jgi:hypothetical protein